MRLSDIAEFVSEKIELENIALEQYVTTDSLLPNKQGRETATNLPPQSCKLTYFKPGDVLVANIRPYLKKVWMADCEGGSSADVLTFRAKQGHSSAFLYAVLLQDAFLDYAMLGAKGSKMPRGDKEQIMRYKMPTFSPTDEEKIGNLIVNLNKKVANSIAINHNLEAMAKQLYDYWFVQFDFPNAEGKPYKSSGGKMVWNEKLKREIPEGWCVSTIADLMPIITGKEDANFSVPNGKYKFFTCSKEVLNCNDAVFHGDAVLLSGNGDIHTKYYSGDFNAYQRTYVLIAETPLYFAATYFVCTNEIQRLLQRTSGSIIKFITKGMIERIPVLITDRIELYERLNLLLKQCLLNKSEIESLTKQRDELLPLLMNGQVSVNYDL